MGACENRSAAPAAPSLLRLLDAFGAAALLGQGIKPCLFLSAFHFEQHPRISVNQQRLDLLSKIVQHQLNETLESVLKPNTCVQNANVVN